LWVDSAGSQLLSGQGRAVRWAQEEDKIIEGYIKTVARTETISFTVIGGVAMAYELRCFLVAVSRKRPCSCVRRYEGTFVRKYESTSVFPYFRKYGSTFVRRYFRTKVAAVVCMYYVALLYRTKVRRYFRTSYFRTRVLPTCTCSRALYLRKYFRTKVLSKIEYFRKYLRSSYSCTRRATRVQLYTYAYTIIVL